MRRKAKRCPQCLIPRAFCICGLMPPLDLPTRISVIIHYGDSFRTTNTGKWLPVALSNAQTLVRGDQASPLDVSPCLLPRHHNALLFPSVNSQLLDPEALSELDQPLHLIVPDGNWNQATKMEKREPALADLPRYHLSPGPPSRYRLRQAAHGHWVSTFEAVARALGVVEGQEVQEKLEYFFDVAVERILFLKGQLKKDKVTGGVTDEMIRLHHQDHLNAE